MYILGTYVSYDFVMIALIAVFLLSLYASGKVQRTFKKYSDQPGSRGVTAGQAAREMLHAHNSGVQVTEVSGSLTDHFDPTRRLVGLSNAVYGSSSISALAVAAHEIGHVLQYEEGYSLMTLRSKILPAAQLGSNAARGDQCQQAGAGSAAGGELYPPGKGIRRQSRAPGRRHDLCVGCHSQPAVFTAFGHSGQGQPPPGLSP